MSDTILRHGLIRVKLPVSTSARERAIAMTPDDAFDAAVQLLEQRGQLLNAHLFRLVQSDADLFREVRERLIQSGIADDRSGVGLARAAAVKPSTTRSKTDRQQAAGSAFHGADAHHGDAQTSQLETLESEQLAKPEWWLMTGGITQGPIDLLSLGQMRLNGELYSSDVVRQGAAGTLAAVR